jgi:hypothetical protein
MGRGARVTNTSGVQPLLGFDFRRMHYKLNEMNDDRSVPLGDRYDTLDAQRTATVELESVVAAQTRHAGLS